MQNDNDKSIQKDDHRETEQLFEKYVDDTEEQDIQSASSDVGTDETPQEENKEKSDGLKKHKIFSRFQVKDIVFLAITSAVVLVTSAVMPLVVPLQSTIFGIAQVVTGLQLSIFPAIALMKVRKVGSMFFMSVFTGIIQLLMSPAMFVNNIVIGLILELLVILIFRGYEKDGAVFFAVALYNPLSLPFNYVYNLIIGNEVMTAVADNAPLAAVGMSVAVLAISVVGTLIGIRISKELKKAGVFKK